MCQTVFERAWGPPGWSDSKFPFMLLYVGAVQLVDLRNEYEFLILDISLFYRIQGIVVE